LTILCNRKGTLTNFIKAELDALMDEKSQRLSGNISL
jgi:hypothetical protein